MPVTKNIHHIPFAELSIRKLIEYISSEHHNYLKEIIPSLRVHVKTIRKVDGGSHSEIVAVCMKAEELHDLLEQHLNMEEFILFPYLKNVSDQPKENASGNLCNDMILKIQGDHRSILILIGEIRKLIALHMNNFSVSPAFKLFAEKTEILEHDLRLHISIEEQFCFPKVREYLGIQTKI